jgi:hypothetical protein
VAIIALMIVTVALVAGGVSFAAIPDSSGVVHGCYKAQGTAYPLNVLNTAVHPSCPSGYTAIHWDASPPGIGVGTGKATDAPSGGATCTMGQIQLFAQQGAYIPDNFAVAKGQLLSIALNTTLFALLGTTYGGDGKTTFALPNIQALAPNHMTYAICLNGVFP